MWCLDAGDIDQSECHECLQGWTNQSSCKWYHDENLPVLWQSSSTDMVDGFSWEVCLRRIHRSNQSQYYWLLPRFDQWHYNQQECFANLGLCIHSWMTLTRSGLLHQFKHIWVKKIHLLVEIYLAGSWPPSLSEPQLETDSWGSSLRFALLNLWLEVLVTGVEILES